MKRMNQTLVFILTLALTTVVFAAKAEETAPVAVNVVKASMATWQENINSTGTLVAALGVTVKPDISGRITEILFKSGMHVEKGTPLVQIFQGILQAELKENESDLKLKELTYTRFEDLFKKNAASQSQVDEAKANFSQAQAVVDKTKAQLSQTLIKAPFSGFLGIRKVNLGDYVSAGDALVNLEDTDPMFVDFTVPEIYSKKILKGQTILITSEAYGDKDFSGKIVAMDSLINPNTRMLEIRGMIPNKDNTLIPGSFVVTKIYIGEPKQLIKIPQTAIEYSQQSNYVYVVKEGKAIKTPVILGARGDKDIFIKSGLKVGDEVVFAGQQRLYNGAEVSIEPS